MDKLLTRKEVADKLAISVDTLKRWEREGKITAIKLPGAVRFKEAHLEGWIEKRTIKSKPHKN